VPVPHHHPEKLRGARLTDEGERKQVTVLFADVMGSMDLAEQSDPETWRSVMERFFSILCEGVHRFEGTVDKFTGDGVMAIFGAPIAHEDHAPRACFAALHLQERLADFAAELRREQGLNLSTRIGLNSGEVVVGTIGEDLSLEYTAIGHTVGLAQRMEALAEPNRTYLTAHTAELVSGYLALKDLGEFTIKGASRPLQVFELAGVGDARTRLEISQRRGFSRFVGRQDEYAVLETALRRTLEGDGQVVGVVGEAGVGKSRLCHEVVERARRDGIPVYHAAGSAHGQHVPFLAALEMVRGYFGVTGQEGDQEARERIAGRLLLLDPGFAEDLPLLFDFLGVPDSEHPAPKMAPEARQRRLIEVIKRLVHAHSRREPAINLLEDLHWIDDGSAVFLEALVDALPGTRSLAIVNFRPEYRAEWMNRSHYQQLSVTPLGPEAVDALLSDLLGDDPSLGAVNEEIQRRTGGNPFFVEEVVRTLEEDGTLSGTRGAYRLESELTALRVPRTVQAVLAARIDRLAPRDKSLLHAAAVMGREFGEHVLERVSGLAPAELAVGLRTLTAAEFLYQQSLYPEPEYAFRHPLTHEVAYSTQLAEHRVRAHAAVAAAITELHPDSLDERAATIAGHWENAGESREAARWHARAAAWVGLSDPREAERHWRRVSELVATLPEDAETAGLAIGARIWILQIGWRLGMAEEEANAVFSEARDIALRQDDTASLCLLLASKAGMTGLAGRMEEALAGSDEADRLAAALGADHLRMANMAFRIYANFCLGNLQEALALSDFSVELAREDPTLGAGIAIEAPLAWAHLGRGFTLMNLGRLAEAREALDRSLAIATEYGDRETAHWALMMDVWLGYYLGVTETMLVRGQQAYEGALQRGDVFSRVWAAMWFGAAHMLSGDADEAVALLESAIAMAQEHRTGLEGASFARAMLARALLRQGRVDEAIEVAREGVQEGIDRGLLATGTIARHALGLALLESDPANIEEAEREFRAAIAWTEAHGALSLQCIYWESLGDAAALRGDEAEAARCLATAARIAEEIGAPARVASITTRLARVG
jgi:class 3 adenylate cyclase/tetratricopeptide (TPR) repeat protein